MATAVAHESKRKDSSNLSQLENIFIADTELKPDGLDSYTPDQIVAALKAVTNSFGIPGNRMSQPTSEEIGERRAQLRLYMGLMFITAARWDAIGAERKS
jgi:hypothetical protein